MKTFLIFIISISLLVTIHEMGHYLAARFFNVKVLRFSIGFGGEIFSKRFGQDQTEWVISWVPLGGYVRMLDEHQDVVLPEERHRAYTQLAPFKRMIIAFAGPFTNFLFAILVYFLIFLQGVPDIRPILGEIEKQTPAAVAGLAYGQEILKINGEPIEGWSDVHWALLKNTFSDQKVQIEVAEKDRILIKELILDPTLQNHEKGLLSALGFTLLQPIRSLEIDKVIPNQAGARAGLKPNDKFLTINQQPILRWEQLTNLIRHHPNQALTVEVLRNGQPQKLVLTPDAIEQDGKMIGKIGVAPKIDPVLLEKMSVTLSYPVDKAFSLALIKTWDMSVLTLKALGRIFTGQLSPKNVTGPLSMANYAEKSTHGGMSSYFTFLALVSLSLFVFNLLPIPVLDGGHILLLSIEMIQGKPLSEKMLTIGQYIGIGFILLLTSVAFYNDITRFLMH